MADAVVFHARHPDVRVLYSSPRRPIRAELAHWMMLPLVDEEDDVTCCDGRKRALLIHVDEMRSVLSGYDGWRKQKRRREKEQVEEKEVEKPVDKESPIPMEVSVFASEEPEEEGELSIVESPNEEKSVEQVKKQVVEQPSEQPVEQPVEQTMEQTQENIESDIKLEPDQNSNEFSGDDVIRSSLALFSCDKPKKGAGKRPKPPRSPKPDDVKVTPLDETYCYDCAKDVHHNIALFYHNRQYHSNCYIPCDVCGKRMKNRGGMHKHKLRHLGECELTFGCLDCEKRYREKKYLQTHCATTGHRMSDEWADDLSGATSIDATFQLRPCDVGYDAFYDYQKHSGVYAETDRIVWVEYSLVEQKETEGEQEKEQRKEQENEKEQEKEQRKEQENEKGQEKGQEKNKEPEKEKKKEQEQAKEQFSAFDFSSLPTEHVTINVGEHKETELKKTGVKEKEQMKVVEKEKTREKQKKTKKIVEKEKEQEKAEDKKGIEEKKAKVIVKEKEKEQKKEHKKQPPPMMPIPSYTPYTGQSSPLFQAFPFPTFKVPLKTVHKTAPPPLKDPRLEKRATEQRQREEKEKEERKEKRRARKRLPDASDALLPLPPPPPFPQL